MKDEKQSGYTLGTTDSERVEFNEKTHQMIRDKRAKRIFSNSGIRSFKTV